MRRTQGFQAIVPSPSGERQRSGFLGQLPGQSRMGPFTGPKDTLAAMERIALGPRGERSYLVRQFTETVTQHVAPKDYLGEILAIRNVFLTPSPWAPGTPLVRYMNDPRHVEWIKDPQRMVEEIHERGTTIADCLPEHTLVLGKGFQFIPLSALVPGTEIWGLDGWTKVKAVSFKGSLPVSGVKMNNGSTVVATQGHRFSVELCSKHDEDWLRTKPCACSDRRREVIKLADLQRGMVLSVPDRLPFGSEDLDYDRALLEGFYISDGWSSPSGFDISGQDGCPKEEQKREVERICKEMGVRTRWMRKSIYVAAGQEWMKRISGMGKTAPYKRLLTIDLGEQAAAGYLRGVMADSGANTGAPPTSRTFTTTSRTLMLQTRILHRMFGVSCGYAFIENHGGLGTHPIWRLSTRTNPRKLRVKEVLSDLTEVPCYDLETESGFVYLPEHDVTVHNCDEIALMGATMALQLGREVEFIALGFKPRELTHVGFRVREPKGNMWIWVDPVAGPREREAAATAKEMLPWSLD